MMMEQDLPAACAVPTAASATDRETPAVAACGLHSSLHLMRFQLVETAEDPVQWANRARRQWGGSTPTVALRVMLGTHVVGVTPPQAIDFGPIAGSSPAPSGGAKASHSTGGTFVGIDWSHMGRAVGPNGSAGGVCFDLPGLCPTNAVLTLEVLNFATVPPTLSGICVIHAAALSTQSLAQPGPFSARKPTIVQKFAVHCHPNASTSQREKDATTHALLVVDLRITSVAALALHHSMHGPQVTTPSTQVSRAGSFCSGMDEARPDDLRHAAAATSLLVSNNSSLSFNPLLPEGSSAAALPPPLHGQALSPLDFNFGSVRLSTTSLFFPTTFLTPCGSYVVSNIVCAMNNTEDSIISLRVVVSERNGGGVATPPDAPGRNRNSPPPQPTASMCKGLLIVHPREAVALRPQQRAFFSITWGVGKPPVSSQSLQHNVSVQLEVQRGTPHDASIAPIALELNCCQPSPDEMHKPFHYWVNTTMVSNRPLHEEHELPYVRSVLPVFLLLHKAATEPLARGGKATSTGGGDASTGDEMLFVKDKDRGGLVMVRGGGHASTPGSSFAAPAAMSFAASSDGSEPTLSSSSAGDIQTNLRPLQPWEILIRSRPPKVDVTTTSMRFIIHMGQLRGLPMVVSSSISLGGTIGAAGSAPQPTSPRGDDQVDMHAAAQGSTTQGSAPAFRVSITPMQPGWSVTRPETTPAYQAQSGALNWVGDTLEVLKQPTASVTQCLRLDLYEVNLADDDAIPIGCALISLPAAPFMPQVMRLPVAFYVYDSYSLYDKLSTTSLVFRDVAMEVVRVAA